MKYTFESSTLTQPSRATPQPEIQTANGDGSAEPCGFFLKGSVLRLVLVIVAASVALLIFSRNTTASMLVGWLCILVQASLIELVMGWVRRRDRNEPVAAVREQRRRRGARVAWALQCVLALAQAILHAVWPATP